MNYYFDRKGKPLADVFEWDRLNQDPEYRIVAEDSFDGIEVRTIWIGLNVYGSGPTMFGTGVKKPREHWDEVETYDTEDEARAGHAKHVAGLRTPALKPAELVHPARSSKRR